MSDRQLGLRFDGRRQADADWRRVLDAIRDVVDYVGAKEVAFDLDLQPSALSNALAERDRHPRADWIPYLIRRAPSLELARALVAPGGLDVVEPPPMTPEQELARLKETLSEVLAPELRAAIYSRAQRRNVEGK